MRTLARRNEWFPEIFNDFFGTNWVPTLKTNTTAPAINVMEKENGYVVEVAAPGMSKDDFSIELNEDDNLVIKLEKKTEQKEEETPENQEAKKNFRYLRREFSYAKYQQTLILPEDVDREAIGAKVEHGVLTVELPKLQPKEKANISRKIEIG